MIFCCFPLESPIGTCIDLPEETVLGWYLLLLPLPISYLRGEYQHKIFNAHIYSIDSYN